MKRIIQILNLKGFKLKFKIYGTFQKKIKFDFLDESFSDFLPKTHFQNQKMGFSGF